MVVWFYVRYDTLGKVPLYHSEGYCVGFATCLLHFWRFSLLSHQHHDTANRIGQMETA